MNPGLRDTQALFLTKLGLSLDFRLWSFKLGYFSSRIFTIEPSLANIMNQETFV